MFNAFISYSHAADDKFAPALQNALQKFAKPWYKKRNLEIYRDESSLDASPNLKDNITKALDNSEYLILLASPLSEKSDWVNKEVAYWLEHRSSDTILIALTEGDMLWDNQSHGFLDPDNNSLPPALDNVFKDEPFYVDLRQSKTEEDVSLDNPIFKKEVLKLAAKLHNKTPNDLASEEVTVHRKMMIIRNLVIGALSVLFLGATALGIFANEKKKEAVIETKKAQSLTLSAISSEQIDKNPTLALRLAELLMKIDSTPKANLMAQKNISKMSYQFLERKLVLFNKSFEHKSDVFNAEFSYDDRKIFVDDIWDMETGNRIDDFLNGDISQTNVFRSTISPSKKLLFTLSYSNVATIWDATTGNSLHKLDRTEDVIQYAVFSQDDNYLATVSSSSLIIWDVSKGVQLHSLYGSNPVFSPDGKKLLTSNDYSENAIEIWDVKSGKRQIIKSIPYIDYGGYWYNSSGSFSLNSQKFITSSSDAIARIWGTESGEILSELKGHKDRITDAVFSHDGSQVVTSSVDNTVKIWDVQSEKIHADLVGHRSSVNSVEFSPDGKKIVTTSNDNTAKIWDSVTGELLFDLMGHTNWVISASFSSDSKQVVTTSSDKTSKIWNIASSGQLLNTIGKTQKVESISFSPNGELVVTGSKDGTVIVWNVINGKKIVLDGHTEEVVIAEFSPDGKNLITSSRVSEDTEVKVWNANSGKLNYNLGGQSIYVHDVTFSPNGNYIVTANPNGIIKMWDLRSGKHLYDLPEGGYENVFSHDSKKLFIATFPSISILNVESGKIIDSLVVDKEISTISTLELNHDEKLLAQVIFDEVIIWDVNSGEQVSIDLIKQQGKITRTQFSQNGKWLLSVSDYGPAKIWDLTSGNNILDLIEQTEFSITSAVFSPDDKYVMIASEDEKVKIWDVITGELIFELEGTNPSFSDDGKKLITIDNNKTAKIFITPKGLMAWLNKNDNIYKLTSEDLKGLGIDFIDLKLLEDNTINR